MRLTFRKKALLFALPILCLVSIVYTYEAIRTEKALLRSEIIKRAEAITALATKTGELPILSSNPELLKGAVSSLKDNSEVSSVSLYDKEMNLLAGDEPPAGRRLPVLSTASPISMFDEGKMFVFYAPVFTVKAAEEVDIFHESSKRELRENIGWIRLGFSKTALNEALKGVVLRGFTLAAAFTVGSSVALIFLITLATKPVTALLNAVKKLEKGEYPEIRDVTSRDEIGELAVAFNGMSSAIKDRESKLKESENRIRDLFERVEHAIFRLDKTGAIIETNAKFRELFGNVDALCEILDGDDRVGNCFRKALSSNAVHMEEKARAKDGGELTVLFSLYPETDPKGEINGFDGYVIDMTEKKRLEERLLRSQKLEAVGTLAGGIAHDFNNILQAILGYTELMMDTTKEGDQFHKPVTIIYNAVVRGAELTKTILSVTRKEKMEIKPIDINEIVRSSLELLTRSFPKNIDIIVNLGQDVPRIIADPTQVQQVILNLAINARDAMTAGGRMVIETAVAIDEDGKNASQDRRFVRLAVSDSGTGMDKTTQERIFDPFFTTKDAGKGTGLGLYIVHSIVNNHGGHINLYSEEGRGTRFNVYLPIEQGDVTYEYADSKDILGSGTILVIDDEEHIRQMCTDMLAPLGYEILLADGGEDGIELFRNRKDSISVVMLDMIMPKTSGNEVFQALKAVKPDVKILLCSGYSQNGYEGIERLLKSGATGFIQKPFTRQYIARALKKALSE